MVSYQVTLTAMAIHLKKQIVLKVLLQNHILLFVHIRIQMG